MIFKIMHVYNVYSRTLLTIKIIRVGMLGLIMRNVQAGSKHGVGGDTVPPPRGRHSVQTAKNVFADHGWNGDYILDTAAQC